MVPVVQVFSGPVSRSPFLPLVNPNTVVRRHLSTHSSLVSLFLPRTAWYQLYPGEPSPFSEPDIIVFAGDVVSLSVLAPSSRVKIVNLTNGMRAEQNLTSNTLCGQRAEWIVDDRNSMAFPNFGTVTFTDAVAAGTGGEGYYAASQGSLTDVKKNGRGRTYTSVSSDFSVTIKYVEPKEQATSPDTSRRS